MVDGSVGAVPFGMVGLLPHVERGWVKKCKETSGWQKQPVNKVDTKECGFTPAKEGRKF